MEPSLQPNPNELPQPSAFAPSVAADQQARRNGQPMTAAEARRQVDAEALPEGLVALGAEVLTLAPSVRSNLAQGDTDLTNPGSIFIGPDGGFVFDPGDVANPGDNDAGNDTIVLRVTARVEDVASVNPGSTLVSTATATLTDPDRGEPITYADSEMVEVVGPTLDIDKTADVTLADAGDVVTYTLTSTNTGTDPAYDAIIDDPLADSGLAANPGSIPPSSSSTPAAPT